MVTKRPNYQKLMLLDKKASANLTHIKWVSKQIRVLNVFASAKTVLARQTLSEDLYRAGKISDKPYTQEDIDKRLREVVKEEKRVSIESLESSDFSSDSIVVQILLYPLRVLGQVTILALWIIFWLPIHIVWNKLKSFFN
ncbi:hypothetical protein ICN46_06555 [Polynucleobacter sp. Latsch14-2]|jgi:hypothetical protein|uniref:hypothetical protein n=1 Tax=Polynucleobacter sp. Latsch14-2 TaxID=2576920 RepID=UPI001BFE42BD|nr:hypothetical protein [Polynucleobacter sp. Latsch14-2]MBT8573491.1 hypothetical protein [Polynucleobacter paneuropaeus]MBU3614550.1 hypothetical protein [Polynucleobacter sp. Latsch14-2]